MHELGFGQHRSQRPWNASLCKENTHYLVQSSRSLQRQEDNSHNMCFYSVSGCLVCLTHVDCIPSDKSGVMTTANGLRIACLGGIYDANLYSVSESIHVRYITIYISKTDIRHRALHLHSLLALQSINFSQIP